MTARRLASAALEAAVTTQVAPARRLRTPPPDAPPLFDTVAGSTITVPGLRFGLVSRTALVNRLRAQSARPVVAVTAPSGYGKTTALAQWANRDPRPFAWVSIDERDGDAIFLLRHVAAALHELTPLEPHVLDAFAAPGPSMWTSVLPRLAAALVSSPPLVLVLDDAHRLHSADSIGAIQVLADHLGPGSVLVLAGRVAPRLPLAALRAAGRLFDVGVEELALTAREGQLLFRQTGAKLSLDEATTLVRGCEGWPAALYLSAVTRREVEGGRRSAEQRIPFGGRESSLAAYFRSEYLSRQPSATVQFLTRTSILEKMCGGLCDAVLGKKGSARELEKIERSNLFLVPLDRQRLWYRYHRLFRDALRRELAEREPVAAAALHRRAADWYERHQDPESALDHACEAGDARRIARIFTTIALPMYHSGRVATVERWFARLDNPKLLERYPLVAVQGSWIHALRGRAAEAERWLRLGEIGLSRGAHAPEVGAWTKLIRAALGRDGASQMIADAETALTGFSSDDPVRPSALMVLGAGHMLLGQNGRADTILAEAAAEADRLGATDAQVVAISQRSIIAAAENDAEAAEKLAHAAKQLVERGRLEGYATTAIAFAAAARASLRQGRWDEARADLDRVGGTPSLNPGLFPWLVVQTRIEFARAYVALREARAARTLLAEIRDLLRERPNAGVLVDEVELLEREVEAIPDHGRGSVGLTPAELRLLPFLTTHLSFPEIGAQLYVSRNTIKTQAISVYRKLGVTNRSEAIACAVRLGLVDALATPSEAFTPHG